MKWLYIRPKPSQKEFGNGECSAMGDCCEIFDHQINFDIFKRESNRNRVPPFGILPYSANTEHQSFDRDTSPCLPSRSCKTDKHILMPVKAQKVHISSLDTEEGARWALKCGHQK